MLFFFVINDMLLINYMMLFGIAAISTQVQHVKNDSDSNVPSRKCDSQLLPLPVSSPPRDDLFIDDASDVDAGDEYVFSF